MATTIRVSVSRDGSDVNIEVDGFSGPGCEKLTHDLEAAIGTVQKSERTMDYYKEEPLYLNTKVGS